MRLMKKVGWVVAGILMSVSFAAHANKDAPLPVEELRAFTEVFGRIKSDYVEPVTDKKLLIEAINGMLNGLDPHSAYLDAEAFKELNDTTHGEFGGLGIEVGMEDGLVKVISPIEDTPAFQAGIKSGDLIIKMDDTLVKGLSLNDAVSHMRGKAGSKIILTISRKNEPKLLTFTLIRAIIKVQSVKSKQIEAGYGYVRITQFQEQTGENLASALETLYKQNQGSLKGLVLDLRNNPGGLLTSAVGVSAAFLNKDALIVYTEGRTDDAKMQLTANPQNYSHSSGGRDYLSKLPETIKNVPLIVLVNGGSASASEIVAGALQDHKRAIILGTQTFGKGSVQTILPLGNSTGIKLTTARYYTPNGRSIQAKGIEPDIVVEDPSAPHEEGLLTLHEADLGRHLINDKNTEESSTTPPKKSSTPASEIKEETARSIPVEFGSKNDYQFNQAINLLKGMQVLKRYFHEPTQQKFR